jgi:uncharacterized lipoprotein YddW (UPF0748 family)
MFGQQQLKGLRAPAAVMSLAVMCALAGCDQRGGWWGREPSRPEPKPRPQPQPTPGPVAKPPAQPPLIDVWPVRGVWVARDEYTSPQQIAAMMDAIARSGFNAVFFQVRGRGTVLYRSEIEPFAYDYPKGTPWFDPLAVACQEAHARGLSLHAWLNVMPAWSGDKRPPYGNHLYYTHPEWFLVDQKGRRQPMTGWYISLNPCLPEVRSYLVSVCREIVSNYPVDGLHLDYIRFPLEKSPKGSDYPYDPRTIEFYRQATGLKPWQNKSAWSQWRTAQVTQVVREIRTMLQQEHPKVRLTAACTADLAGARKYSFQDGPSWLRSGLVDEVFTMNYTSDMRLFRSRQEAWQRAAGRMPAVGIGVYLHKSDWVSVEQLKLAQQWGRGFSLFSSPYLYDAQFRAYRRLIAMLPLLKEMKQAALRQAQPGAATGGKGAPAHRIP